MKSAERASLRSLLVLAALAAVVFLAALLIGSSGIGVRRALEALGGSGDAATRSVLLGVRLPRVLAAFGVGSLLALSGVLLQALFRNPLADPYVLGVSGGAAVGALLAMIAGAAALLVQSAAVAGALAAVGTVYVLARGGGTPRLLLTGVVLASACGALVSVLLALADTSRVRGMVFWLAGDLEWAVSPAVSAGAAALAVALAVVVARPLNVLAAGELRARTVGLALEAWRAPRSSWRCCGAAADDARASFPPRPCAAAPLDSSQRHSDDSPVEREDQHVDRDGDGASHEADLAQRRAQSVSPGGNGGERHVRGARGECLPALAQAAAELRIDHRGAG